MREWAPTLLVRLSLHNFLFPSAPLPARGSTFSSRPFVLVPLGSLSRHGFLDILQRGVWLATIDHLFDKSSETSFVFVSYCAIADIHTAHPSPTP
jgi:hypothetical protein